MERGSEEGHQDTSTSNSGDVFFPTHRGSGVVAADEDQDVHQGGHPCLRRPAHKPQRNVGLVHQLGGFYGHSDVPCTTQQSSQGAGRALVPCAGCTGPRPNGGVGSGPQGYQQPWERNRAVSLTHVHAPRTHAPRTSTHPEQMYSASIMARVATVRSRDRDSGGIGRPDRAPRSAAP
jgi:hypothetical protein